MAEQTAARVVGIDLGTTNSLVAFMQGDAPTVIPGEDGDRLVPSVVAFDQEQGFVVGNAARATLLTDAASCGVLGEAADGARRGGCAGGAEAVSVQAGRRACSRARC